MIMIISVFSELIMALLTIYLIPILDDEVYEAKRSRLIISLLFVMIISACFNLIFRIPNIAMQSVALTLNYTKFIVAAIIIYKKINIKIVCLTLIVHTICSLCVAGISFVVPVKHNIATCASELLLLAIRSSFLLFTVFFRKKCEKWYLDNIFKILPDYIYILVLINLFIADGLMEAANYKFPETHIKEGTVKLLVLALSLCVFVTLISLLFSVVSKKYFSDINMLLENQIQTQISYYEDREKTYAEIRRFKHDYINHISCIRSMLKAERYDEISEYLGNITDMLPADKLSFNTGNFISDAILSDKQNRIKKENITIEFDGTIPTSINEADLCIILGNAIDNAIEACLAFDGEKKIMIYGGFSHSYFILKISNPTNKTESNNIFPFTTKPNRTEHGFGLLNIKSVVDKYSGYMKIDNKDNVFTLSLTFNSIISECVKT